MNFSNAKSRHPDEFLLLLLCLSAGLTIVFGDVPAPDSIEASLPRWAAVGWGIGILLGPLVTLVGIFWPGRRASDGLITEQVGQGITGTVAAYYAVVLLTYAWPAAVFSAFIVLAFGAARVWRFFQIQKILRAAHQEVNGHAE
jgi:sugar phosphate permease